MENENKSYEEIQKKEQEELEKMSEEERKLFCEFKEKFIQEFPKNYAKEISKEIKFRDRKINQDFKEQSEIDAKKALEKIDFIELYYSQRKELEIKIYLETIFKNCSTNKEIHNLAYQLNDEYKLLWDNLQPATKEKVVNAWSITKVTNGIDKFRLGIATFGISALIEQGTKNKKIEEYKKYVTSDSFTQICIEVNKYLKNK